MFGKKIIANFYSKSIGKYAPFSKISHEHINSSNYRTPFTVILNYNNLISFLQHDKIILLRSRIDSLRGAIECVKELDAKRKDIFSFKVFISHFW